jgi:pyruvate/2-oxoglutarate dehydrogenase complex dihydrolipoamide dehydrogenase (E3) component
VGAHSSALELASIFQPKNLQITIFEYFSGPHTTKSDNVEKESRESIEEVGEKILTVVQDRVALDSDDRYQRDVRRVGKWSNDR